MADPVLRVYEPSECGADGYPLVWHKLSDDDPAQSALMNEADMVLPGGVKDVVRALAGHRCVRCLHPYRSGHHGDGEWSPCDARCTHGVKAHNKGATFVAVDGSAPYRIARGDDDPSRRHDRVSVPVGATWAQWRILTVHHLRLGTDAKRDLRWWNLAALCQRCHLQIQGKVQMERIWPWPHSYWFKPYAAGWYAWSYLGLDLARAEVEARMDEFLALELAVVS